MEENEIVVFDCALMLEYKDDQYRFYFTQIDNESFLDFLLDYEFKELIRFDFNINRGEPHFIVNESEAVSYKDFNSIYSLVQKLNINEWFSIDNLDIFFKGFYFNCDDMGIYFAFDEIYKDELKLFITKILNFSFNFNEERKNNILEGLFVELNSYIKINQEGANTGVYSDFLSFCRSYSK